MNALKMAIVLSCILIVVCVAVSPCSAQVYPYYPFFNPFYAPFSYPAPYFPTMSVFSPPILSPLLNPFPALPTLPFRNAAATIITLPAASPVTASAPLGTVNLTPSSLVLLILYLTLAE